MKRKALAFILLVIFAISAAAWLVYNQVSELQNQISELKAQNRDLQDQNTELQNQTSELKQQLNYLQNQTYRGLDVEITEFEWIEIRFHVDSSQFRCRAWVVQFCFD
jgi:septal ring factor EnvC (AmiA/AmiB activator)